MNKSKSQVPKGINKISTKVAKQIKNKKLPCLHFPKPTYISKNAIHILAVKKDPDYKNFYKKGQKLVLVNYENYNENVKIERKILVEVLQTAIQMANKPIFYSVDKSKGKIAALDLIIRGLGEVTGKIDTQNAYLIVCESVDLKPLKYKNKKELTDLRKVIEKKLRQIFSYQQRKNFFGVDSFKQIESVEQLLDLSIQVFTEQDYVENEELSIYIEYKNYDKRYDYIDKILDNVLKRVREEYDEKQKEQGSFSFDRKGAKGSFNTDEKKKYYHKIKDIDKLEEDYKEQLYRVIKTIPPEDSSTKANVLEYLDTVISIPFDKVDKVKKGIKEISNKLDELQYGFKSVKQRILEYIAVQKKTKGNSNSPIVCLTGPPGVGKTFFAKNIAKAMGKRSTTISLGGMDEVVMLRGSQRGWVGSEPGLVIKAFIKTKTMNPIIILDEIDKVGESVRGAQVQSALLEILDPNQNYEFRDHYISFPVDISNAVFVATANYKDDIPYALRDRLDIVEIEGYTDSEKVDITLNYLYPKVLQDHDLSKNKIKVTKKAWSKLIDSFAHEPGMRGISKAINQIVRKVILDLSTSKKKTVRINEKNLKKYCKLSSPYTHKLEIDKKKIGVGIGMYATTYRDLAIGGGPLVVEVKVLKGEGELQMTGLVEKVMKESILIAKTYIRANCKKLGIKDKDIQNKDLSIHMPEGAIPKDGPSAGAIITVTIISALLGKPIRQDIALTGEIDLQGNILAVGGIKQKVSGTHRKKIKEFVIPEANKNDWKKIPKEVRSKSKVHFVKHISEIIDIYFEKLSD